MCVRVAPFELRNREIWLKGYKYMATKSFLQKGDSGEDVKKMQEMLIACGYSCGSTGVDGKFGNATLNALKTFQKNMNLNVDGYYGQKTKSALTTLYNSKKSTTNNSKSNAAEVFLNAVKRVAEIARTNGWIYGNSGVIPPCSDKTISCDRLVARALFDLGYVDQRVGGEVCSTLNSYLISHGWKRVTDKRKIKPGAVVAVRNIPKNIGEIDHVFVVSSYNPDTDLCDKYDEGSNERIKAFQPFSDVKLVEWGNRVFECAWNVPDNLKGATAGGGASTVYNGLDYSRVYNYAYYKNKYADLRKAFANNEKAYFTHFCNYGMKEGRQASASFNVYAYKSRYKDLQKSFGNNLPLYYKHYIEFGIKEKRNAI